MKSIYKLLVESLLGLTLTTGCGAITQSIKPNENFYECVEESDGLFSPRKRIVVGAIPKPVYMPGRDPHSVTHNENEQRRSEEAQRYCIGVFHGRNSSSPSTPPEATPLTQTSRSDMDKYEKEQTVRNGQEVDKEKYRSEQAKSAIEEKKLDYKIEGENTKQAQEHSVRLASAKPNVHYGPVGGSVAITSPPVVGGPTFNNVGYGGGMTAWVDHEMQEQHLSSSLTEELKKKLSSIEKEGEISGYHVEKIGKITFADCEFRNGQGIDAVAEALSKLELNDRTIVLYGSADTRSAKNCGSQTNPDLAGHRAASTLVDLEAKLNSKIHEAHVDIIAGGTALNERSVDIYLVGEKGKYSRNK